MAVDDSYTKSLLHFNGADASTTFSDESSKSWTRYGNAQIDTAESKFGGTSGKFDGTGDGIDTPDNSDFDFGSGDFTIDMWVNFASGGGGGYLFAKTAAGAVQDSYEALVTGSKIYFYYSTDGSILNAGAISNTINPFGGPWYHFAFVRYGSNWTWYIDGQQSGSNPAAATLFASTSRFSVGFTNRSIAYTPWNGWIDEVRVSKGIARYTGNFTPPTYPYQPASSFPASSFLGDINISEEVA